MLDDERGKGNLSPRSINKHTVSRWKNKSCELKFSEEFK